MSSRSKNAWSTLLIAPLFMSGLIGCQSSSPMNSTNVSSYPSANASTFSFQASDPQRIAEVRTQMAAQYIKDNELDAAQRQLERAFEANSRYAPAYDMMGVLLQKEGSQSNIQKAETYYKKAIQLDPNLMQAHNNYGVYLSQVGRYQEAIAQFEIAGAALGYTGRIGALENLGQTALKVNNKTLATNAFIRALEGNRNSLVAHIELVDILISSDHIEQAQNLFDETLALVGNDANNSPRILLQGIKLAHAQNNLFTQEELSQLLLANFPLSEEAQTLKSWIRNSEATWK